MVLPSVKNTDVNFRGHFAFSQENCAIHVIVSIYSREFSPILQLNQLGVGSEISPVPCALLTVVGKLAAELSLSAYWDHLEASPRSLYTGTINLLPGS